MFKTIRAMLTRAAEPSYDRLINQANREMHLFHLGKYRSYEAASKHRRLAQELYKQARELKGK